jgi:hypothetical protein
MFKNILTSATGLAQSNLSRLIIDPDALDFTDTPSLLSGAGVTGTNEAGFLTGSIKSVELDGINDYIKLATSAGLGSEILLEAIGDDNTGVKHGSTANNIVFESWIKIDSSITAIDNPSQYYEATIQRSSTASFSGFDGIYSCKTIFATSADDSSPSSPGYNAAISAHFIEFSYAGERLGGTGPIYDLSMTSACNIPLDTWVNVWCEHTVTASATDITALSGAHTFKIYRNGVLDRMQTGHNLISKANAAEGSSQFPSTSLRDSYWYDSPKSFDGRVDEMRMWLNSATTDSITALTSVTGIGLNPDQFENLQQSTYDQFAPSGDYLAAWWRFETLSAIDLFASVADCIPDVTAYGHSGTPYNFEGAVDFSEEATATRGVRYTDFFKLSGGTVDHGGLSIVEEQGRGNKSILVDEGMENLVVSANNTWANTSTAATINVDSINIFYGSSAVTVNTISAGAGAIHTINYGNLFFDNNDYTMAMRNLVTSGSSTARVTFTLGHLSNSTSTTAVFNKTTWIPSTLTLTCSANADESSVTGSIKVESLTNSSESSNNGSLFRIDGLSIQEGDYNSTFIGPDQIRKSGEINWAVVD